MELTKRVFLIVLDGVGCGALNDAHLYGDDNANTLKTISEFGEKLKIPTLESWGIGNLAPMKNIEKIKAPHSKASYGRCKEKSKGKDTTTGHWEIAGIITEKPFATYPNGFDIEIVNRWCKENNLPGVLGNCAASGTEIIKQYGEEHIKTKKPILYTSADSVWQVACHEEFFDLEKLYSICKSARKICDELNISRVIARPFIGDTPQNFKRTHHRKDFSVHPPKKLLMDYLRENGINTYGVGKIWNIFDGQGIQESIETIDNNDGMIKTIELAKKISKGFFFINLIDFDMNYGHRRDIAGFKKAIEEFDTHLSQLETLLEPNDAVILTADHGNDPGFKGTDHTREYVPFLYYQKGKKSFELGIRETFADIGQTIIHTMTGTPLLEVGTSIFSQ